MLGSAGGNNNVQGNCSICNEDFTNQDPAFCLHGSCNFHKKCIASYAAANQKPSLTQPGNVDFECPNCRESCTHPLGHECPLCWEALNVPNPGPCFRHNGHSMHTNCLEKWLENHTEENWTDCEELKFKCPHCACANQTYHPHPSIDCQTHCPLCTKAFTQQDPAIAVNHGPNTTPVETNHGMHLFHASCLTNFQQNYINEFDDQINSVEEQIKKADKDIALFQPRIAQSAQAKKLYETALKKKISATNFAQELKAKKLSHAYYCPLCERVNKKRTDILDCFDGPVYTNLSNIINVSSKIASDQPCTPANYHPVGGPFINQLSKRVVPIPGKILRCFYGGNWGLELKDNYCAHLASFIVGLLYPYKLCSSSSEKPDAMKTRALRCTAGGATILAVGTAVSSGILAHRMHRLGASRSNLILHSLLSTGKSIGSSLQLTLSPELLAYYLSGSLRIQMLGIPFALYVGLGACGLETTNSTMNAYNYGTLVGALAGLAVRHKQPLKGLASHYLPMLMSKVPWLKNMPVALPTPKVGAPA